MENLYYDSERSFSNSLDDEIRRIIACVFRVLVSEVRIADDFEDIYHATDLMIGKIRIAMRVRRSKWKNNAHEITVRYDLALNGIRHEGDTEYQKINHGYGDFMFYAIASADGKHLSHWVIIDLAKLRQFMDYEEHKYGGPRSDRLKRAKNTGCGFLVYKLDGTDEPNNIVIADSEHYGMVTA